METAVLRAPPRTVVVTEDDWIQTYTGKKISILNPDPALIEWDDIVHALSMICRFGGHSRRFFSVAEHSILVSHLVPKKQPMLALTALLHDAPEAYLGDIIKPLKQHLPEYKLIEKRWAEAISQAFRSGGLNIDLVNLPDDVKDADLSALYLESIDLLAPGLLSEWKKIVPPHLRPDGRGTRGCEIQGLPFEAAFLAFQERFEKLTSSLV